MKIVTFERSAGETPRVGALLEGGLVLDFCAQAADVPAASAHLDWFDADSASHIAARALHPCDTSHNSASHSGIHKSYFFMRFQNFWAHTYIG